MYHILVVDDEKLMRTYLAGSIPSYTSKFQVSGIAEDGLEAIALIKKQHFDVVITDIRMPEVDGLSLAKYIADNFPAIIVIIISGYDDFEYARSAIQYRVTDYLLKPLVDQNLIQLLETVARRLDEQRPYGFLSCANISGEEELQKALVGSILEENSELTYELFHKMQSHGITCPSDIYMLLKCVPDTLSLFLKNHRAFDVTTDHLRLNQILQDICKDYGYTALYNTDGATYILLNAFSAAQLTQQFQVLYAAITKQSHAGNMPKITVFGSKPVNDILELPYALQDIYDITPLSLLIQSAPILSDKTGEYSDFIRHMQALDEQIYTDYLTCNVERLYLCIGKAYSLLQKERDISTMLRLGCYLIQMVCERARVNPSYRSKAYGELFRQANLYQSTGLPDKSTGIQILTATLCALMTSPCKTPVPESGELTAKAKKYILAHYQESISLSDVANHCGVNSSYLSDLFHKTLKEPYTKYLLRIRMEQAARLLGQNPGMKIYEVAAQTGFVSVKHFNTVFKKYYGMTPTEFNGKGQPH